MTRESISGADALHLWNTTLLTNMENASRILKNLDKAAELEQELAEHTHAPSLESVISDLAHVLTITELAHIQSKVIDSKRSRHKLNQCIWHMKVLAEIIESPQLEDIVEKANLATDHGSTT